jgi:hypothetical protein
MFLKLFIMQRFLPETRVLDLSEHEETIPLADVDCTLEDLSVCLVVFVSALINYVVSCANSGTGVIDTDMLVQVQGELQTLLAPAHFSPLFDNTSEVRGLQAI